MKKKLLISFSGGRTSAYMTKWLLENKSDEYDFVIVFANTGKEREETLEFVRDCDLHFGFNTVWIETVMQEYGKGATFKIVDYATASRNGEPFEGVIAKHGIPNQATPHCSRELKSTPIKAYMRSIGWKDYETAIGFRDDEPKRINRKAQKRKKHIYPLFDLFPVSKAWISEWWNKQPFNLRLKNYEGNCDLCWKKHIRKHLTIIQDCPERLEWWQKMQDKYGEFTPKSRLHNEKIKPPHRFFRGNVSTEELKTMSEQYFEPAKDETAKEVYRQLLLYSNYGVDESKGCEESCEPL